MKTIFKGFTMKNTFFVMFAALTVVGEANCLSDQNFARRYGANSHIFNSAVYYSRRAIDRAHGYTKKEKNSKKTESKSTKKLVKKRDIKRAQKTIKSL